MVNWDIGNMNVRYWILKLLKDNFGAGDKLVHTTAEGESFLPETQAFITKTGKKILIINSKNKEIKISLPVDVKGKTMEYVDGSTGENPPAKMQLTENPITLEPFAVAVVH